MLNKDLGKLNRPLGENEIFLTYKFLQISSKCINGL